MLLLGCSSDLVTVFLHSASRNGKQTGFRSELRASELGCPATYPIWQIRKVERQHESIDFNGLDTAIHGPLRLG